MSQRHGSGWVSPLYDPRYQNQPVRQPLQPEPPPPPRTWPRWATAVLAAVGAVLVACASISLLPRYVPAPTAFTPFTDYQTWYTCDAPVGWRQEKWETLHGGIDAWTSDNHAIRFVKGDAEIEVTSYDMGLLSDNASGLQAVNTGTVTMDMPTKHDDVMDVLHRHLADRIQGGMAGYGEMGASTSADTQLPEWDDTLWYEWTATGRQWRLPHGMHGYGFCALGDKIGVTVACTCPAECWPTLRPAFERIVASVKEPAQTPSGLPDSVRAYIHDLKNRMDQNNGGGSDQGGSDQGGSDQ